MTSMQQALQRFHNKIIKASVTVIVREEKHFVAMQNGDPVRTFETDDVVQVLHRPLTPCELHQIRAYGSLAL